MYHKSLADHHPLHYNAPDMILCPDTIPPPCTLTIVGCNHRTTPIALRERLAMDDHRCRVTHASLRTTYPSAASLILSTCNRFELYVASPPQALPTFDQATALIAHHAQIPVHQLQGCLYHHRGTDAMAHLCRVAASLDSMLVGDLGIAWQVRRALDLTLADSQPSLALDFLTGYVNQALALARTTLHTLFQPSSLASLAVQHARHLATPWNRRTVLVIGAGQVATAVLAELNRCPPARLLLTNRSPRPAAKLARRHRAKPIPFDQLHSALTAADVVVATSAAPQPILTLDAWTRIPHVPSLPPKLLIDLAVPRNIDPALANCKSVTLLGIDHLQPQADRFNAALQTDILKAERRIARAVERLSYTEPLALTGA